MRAIHHCPEHVLRLFDRNETRAEGRRQAVEWMKSISHQVANGDVVMLPDAETGELIAFTKTAEGVA